MFLDFWSWVLVVIIVAAIFYANSLPKLKEQAKEKFKEGKILLEKSKKELEAKAIVIAEKAKEKQRIENKEKTNTTDETLEEEKEITIEDLEFMPKEEIKKETKKKAKTSKQTTK